MRPVALVLPLALLLAFPGGGALMTGQPLNAYDECRDEIKTEAGTTWDDGNKCLRLDVPAAPSPVNRQGETYFLWFEMVDCPNPLVNACLGKPEAQYVGVLYLDDNGKEGLQRFPRLINNQLVPADEVVLA